MTLRVMIVEDEFLIALELEFLIRDFGHEVVGIAVDVAGGLKLAEKEEPDVATVDLRLKHNDDGADLARQLLDRFGIRAIFVSGNLDQAMRDRLADLDPYGFVGKPMAPHSLKQLLDLVEAG